MNEANEALAKKVKQYLLDKTDSSGLDVHVRAVDGVITLSGTVDVLADKIALEELAQQVPGVRKVENGLTVSMDGKYTDHHIQKELEARLADIKVARKVTATVSRGRVLLRGEVDDLLAKQAVLEETRATRGVSEIEEQVCINPTEEMRTDDVSITNEVERALAATRVGAAYIKTETKNGTVYLTGWVDDPEELQIVEESVRGVNGVQQIVNEISIRGKE